MSTLTRITVCRVFVIVGALLIILNPYSQTRTYADSSIIREFDITYGTADGIDLKLDFYCPATRGGPFPTLVYIHSGGWGYYEGFYKGFYVAFNKWECNQLINKAATNGYAAVEVDFRQIDIKDDKGA
jgi:predicted acyl esterase